MTSEALVAEIEARGVTLRESDGQIVIRPAKGVTPAEVELLRERKPEVLALLKARDLGVDWSRIRLADLNKVLEISVPWADETLLLAPGCRIARELRERDSRPGRVWCTCEVLDLLLTGATPADARAIAEVKLDFDGVVTTAREGSSPRAVVVPAGPLFPPTTADTRKRRWLDYGHGPTPGNAYAASRQTKGAKS